MRRPEMEQCFGELDVGAVVVVGLAFVGVGVLLWVQNGRTLGSEGRLDNICARNNKYRG
jgi:hypothetical protein